MQEGEKTCITSPFPRELKKFVKYMYIGQLVNKLYRSKV